MSPKVDRRLQDVLEKYSTWLTQLVRRKCPTRLGIDPDDLEQEVRIRLWRALSSERKIASWPSYLYRIVSTVTIDAVRSVRSKHEATATPKAMEGEEDPLAQHPSPAASPEQQTAESHLLERVSRIIDDLPPDRRRAVGLYLQGFKIQEIADLAGWTEPRARNLLYRGLAVLREQLAAQGLSYEDL